MAEYIAYFLRYGWLIKLQKFIKKYGRNIKLKTNGANPISYITLGEKSDNIEQRKEIAKRLANSETRKGNPSFFSKLNIPNEINSTIVNR